VRKAIICALLIFGTLRIWAADLQDVELLSVNARAESLQLKLRAKEAPAGSYFFLEITQSDPEAFAKMLTIIKKMHLKGGFRLDLSLPSFSPSPSGSYYRSEGVLMSGDETRGPSSIKKKKKSQ